MSESAKPPSDDGVTDDKEAHPASSAHALQSEGEDELSENDEDEMDDEPKPAHKPKPKSPRSETPTGTDEVEEVLSHARDEAHLADPRDLPHTNLVSPPSSPLT